jgi:signal transduction histidine kinase
MFRARAVAPLIQGMRRVAHIAMLCGMNGRFNPGFVRTGVSTVTVVASAAVVYVIAVPRMQPLDALVVAVAIGLLAALWLRDWQRRQREQRLSAALRRALHMPNASRDALFDAAERVLSTTAAVQSQAQAQLRETAAQDERNRLARDLHDTIKQQLFGISMAAATAQTVAQRDPAAALAHVAQVATLAEQAQSEMNALLTQLKPHPLATVGLLQAIRDQLEALHFRSEVQVELRGDVLPDEAQLPAGAQEAIFRIVQEALSNIARHARAKQVRLAFEYDAAALRVTIHDDGQGFDPTTSPAGMGLNNMRLRAHELGGDLRIHSGRSEGTQLTLEVPLHAQQHASDDAVNLARAKAFYKLSFSISAVVGAFSLPVWTAVMLSFAAARGQYDLSQTTIWVVVGCLVCVLLGLVCARDTRKRQTQFRALFENDWEGNAWRTQVRIMWAMAPASLLLIAASTLLVLGGIVPGLVLMLLAIAGLVLVLKADASLDATLSDWSSAWLHEQLARDFAPLMFAIAIVLLTRGGHMIRRLIDAGTALPTLNFDLLNPEGSIWLDSVAIYLFVFTIAFGVPYVLLNRRRMRAFAAQSM